MAGHPAERGEQPFPLHDREFVGMMAAIMALNALAIDSMLPAFPAIGRTFSVSEPNRLQFIVTAYLLTSAIGALFAGPLADRFGRRRVMLTGIAGCTLMSLASAIAPSFEALLLMRGAHGLFAASLGVLSISVIRDRFTGDQMARMMSLVFIVFMAVPVLAPSMGQLVLSVAGWREIFHVLAAGALLVGLWVAMRLPETLPPERRQRIVPRILIANWRHVLTERLGLGYMCGAGIMMGGMFGFLVSAQQIFTIVFKAGAIFPAAFAACAATMAFANFSNSRIVERFGARRVSHCALFGVILAGLAQLLASRLSSEPFALFLVLVALSMGMVGFTGANFSSIAMEPFGHVAGTAASFQSFGRLLIGGAIGAFTGQRFDGTTQPLAEGFVISGLLALACILWAERGRLFTRPHRRQLRQPNDMGGR